MKGIVVSLALLVAASSQAVADDFTIDANQLGVRHPHARAGATQVPARSAPRMPAVLAQSAGARSAEMEKMYTQLLSAFDQLAVKAKLPRNDVAVAAAMYIAGSYGAYHGSEVSDAGFIALSNQLRDAIAAMPAFASTPVDKKQDMYESFAIVGTLMWATSKSKPGDAQVRATAKGYLDAFLQGRTDALQITDAGMSFGGAAAPGVPAANDAPDAPAPPAAPAAPAAASFPGSKVTAVLWTAKAQYRAFPENSMVMVETWLMLLADGTCTGGVPGTLEGYDPAAARAKNPKSWCTWRRKGNWYETAWGSGKWSGVESMTEFRGGKRGGEKIEGAWSRQKTGGYGGSSTWAATTLTLHANGRFEISRASHFTTSSSANPPDGEVVVSGSANDDGSITNLSGKNGGMSARGKGRNMGDRGGSYVRDGFSLELHYDSGNVEHHMFGVTSDSKHGTARFGGDIMFGPKK